MVFLEHNVIDENMYCASYYIIITEPFYKSKIFYNINDKNIINVYTDDKKSADTILMLNICVDIYNIMAYIFGGKETNISQVQLPLNTPYRILVMLYRHDSRSGYPIISIR